MTRLASLVLVVRDLERALALYERGLGFARLEDASDLPGVGARHILLRADNCVLELLEPHDETTPPGLFLRARGEGVFAVGVGVEAPDQAADRLAGAGVPVVRSAGPAGEEGPPRRRFFVRPADSHGVLVEVEGLVSERPRGS
jgi:catechol 2,3-dioxygenase-like lactoylglutathione lyase family enzyme